MSFGLVVLDCHCARCAGEAEAGPVAPPPGLRQRSRSPSACRGSTPTAAADGRAADASPTSVEPPPGLAPPPGLDMDALDEARAHACLSRSSGA